MPWCRTKTAADDEGDDEGDDDDDDDDVVDMGVSAVVVGMGRNW